jgi:hypothetical protein
MFSDSVMNLLLRISIKNRVLSSISGWMQVMRECRSEKTEWTIEFSHQRIDLNLNILFQFSDMKNRSNLLASELDLLKNRVLPEECANGRWDRKFGEV